MDNQEAIEILKTERNHMIPTLLPGRIEAMDMAISALQAQDLQPTCNQLATDVISRQAVISYIDRIMHQGTGKNKSFEYIKKYVEKLQSAQPEIIQCKDCKKSWHSGTATIRGKVYEIYKCRLWGNRAVSVDGYCYMAERKEEHTMEEYMYGQDLGDPEDGSL